MADHAASGSVRHNWRVIAICILVSTGALQFGYDSSYFSGILDMQPFVRLYGDYDAELGKYTLSPHVMSIITSIINVGEFVGAVSSFIISNRLGPRTGLFISMACIVIGTVLQTAANLYGVLIAGRLVVGYAVGLLSCLVPLYIADCAPARFRGALVTMYQFFIAIGLVLGVCVDYGTHTRTDTGSFRIPMAMQLLIPLILIPSLLFLAPESPRWLAVKGQINRARHSLGQLYGKADADELDRNLAAIQYSVSQEVSQSSGWKAIFSWGPEGRKAYLACAMQAWSQASGINFIVSYGVVFFTGIGISNPYLINIGLYLVTLPGIFISQVGIEKFGRRPMMLLSGSLIATVLLVMAGCSLDPSKPHALQQAIVAMVFLFLVVFNLAWGPTTWVIVSEIATGPNRGRIIAMATGSNWLFNWLVSFTFPYLYSPAAADLGSKIGFIYGGLMVLGCAWVFFLLPETAGRSLEEIEYMFQHHVPARHFAKFQVPDMSSGELDLGKEDLSEKKVHLEVIEDSYAR